MKKYIYLLLTALLLMTGTPVFAERGEKCLWIECEDNVTFVSGKYGIVEDVNSSGRRRVTLDTETSTEDNIISINFAISYDNEYDVYVLGTNAGWASNYEWCIDHNDYTLLSTISNGDAYVTTGMRAAGISWTKLTTTKFEKGLHSIKIKTNQLPAVINKFYNQIMDAIAIVPSSWNWTPDGIDKKPFNKENAKVNFVSGKVPQEVLTQKQTFKVEVSNRAGSRISGNPKIFTEFVKDGAVLSKVKTDLSVPLNRWAVGKTYTDSINITIPFDMLDGVYDIRTGFDELNYADGDADKYVGTITIGTPPKLPEPYTVSLSGLESGDEIVKDKPVSIVFNTDFSRNFDFQTSAYAGLWKDGLLYEVLEGNGIVSGNGRTEFQSTLKSDLPSGEYELIPGIHKIKSANQLAKKVMVSGTDTVRSKYHKPMTHGYFTVAKEGIEQFWYVNQSYTAFFNGKEYIPVGGMFCSLYLTFYDSSKPEQNETNWKVDVEDFKTLRAAGINDLYFNSNVWQAPAYAWEYMFNYLDENGWEYGVQGGHGVENGETAQTFLPRANTEVGAYAYKGVTNSGKITLVSDIASTAQALSAVYVVINDTTKEVADGGLCGFEVNSTGKLQFVADVTVPEGQDTYTAYFTPQVKKYYQWAFNYWDYKEQLVKKIQELGRKMRPIAGGNFRFFVDLICNESGLCNDREIQRYSSPKACSMFADWLKNKYKNVDALNAAWQTAPAISGFDEAAALIPVHTTDTDADNLYFAYFVHMNTGKYYKVNIKRGVAWEDYLDSREDDFRDMYNLVADTMKEKLNVPIINKLTSVGRDYFVNRNPYGGTDGVGSEAYGVYPKLQGAITQSTEILEQFAHTAWLPVTETNTSENWDLKYETGGGSYPSQESMNENYNLLIDGGATGIFDFLLTDRYDLGGKFQAVYSHIGNPRATPWLRAYDEYLHSNDVKKEVTTKKYAKEAFAIYPETQNWWSNGSERSIVQKRDDTTMLMHITTKAGNSVLSVNDVNVDVRVLMVNLKDAPYSVIFGKAVGALIQKQPEDKKIVVLGHRNDIGTIPEIDKYFTDEKVVTDAGTVQILKPTDTSEILRTTDDGKPWALRDGQLYIIAIDQFYEHEGEFYKILYVDDMGITDAT